MSAWASAMIKAVKNPEQEVFFNITVEGLATMRQSCSRFLVPLAVEEEAIRRYPPEKVLDIGCGVGRHLNFIKGNFPSSDLWGTESDPELRDYCLRNFGPNMMPNHEDIQVTDFSTVLLLGNGIGLFGSVDCLTSGLSKIFTLLRPGGVLIGECGRLDTTHDFDEKNVTITYGDEAPTAFRWLFCTWDWLKPRLVAAGFDIVHEQDIHQEEPGGFLFVAQKPDSGPNERKETRQVDAQMRPAESAGDAPDSDPAQYLRHIHPIRADVFTFDPENCDACALWLRTGFNPLFTSWLEFVRQLEAYPQGGVCQLRLNENQHQPVVPFAIGPGWQPWRYLLGHEIIRIDPPLNRLRLVYFFPNYDDAFISEPAQARSLVMAALETLNEAGAKRVAMNGIQGNPPALDGTIAQTMADAADDWLHMEVEKHRSPVSIEDIYLVDVRGGFGDIHLA